MKKIIILLLLSIGVLQAQEEDAETIKSIYTTALMNNQGYEWLRELTQIGGRLAGSKEANEAVFHFQKIADSLGFKTHLQKVKVPNWNRGDKEVAWYSVNGKKIDASVCALGGSIGTKENGLNAKIVEITSFEQLESFEKELEGKIAFYNIPMNPAFISTFSAYGNAVKQRYVGALEASKKGAVGVVVRSLSSSVNDYPHTGSMTYADAENKIPAIAISTAGAEKLSAHLKSNPDLEFYFKMNPSWNDSVYSYNLVADLPGKELPDEYILIGGHIDSWDIGTGAHDDGAGCMHSLEAAYLLQKLNLLPKRTLRVVFFMNEEFGLDGADEYARQSLKENVNHIIAMESDAGGFSPRGLSIEAPDSIVQKIKELRTLLEPYGIHQIGLGGAGADISRLASEDIVKIGLRPDSHRYFEVHHSALDVFDQVNARELEMGSATMAALIYLLDKYDITAR